MTAITLELKQLLNSLPNNEFHDVGDEQVTVIMKGILQVPFKEREKFYWQTIYHRFTQEVLDKLLHRFCRYKPHGGLTGANCHFVGHGEVSAFLREKLFMPYLQNTFFCIEGCDFAFNARHVLLMVMAVHQESGRKPDNFNLLIPDHLDSDLVVKVDEQSYRVHSFFLKAQSTFFENSSDSVIDLTGKVSAPIFEKLARYMYGEYMWDNENTPEMKQASQLLGMKGLIYETEARAKKHWINDQSNLRDVGLGDFASSLRFQKNL